LHATQLGQLHARQLAKLHADIKARAELPLPPYLKLPRRWPFRRFDVQILPDYVRSPIYYFELFWRPEVWISLVRNTNVYTQYKEARGKGNNSSKLRWWKTVTLYEMRVFIAILIYIGIISASNIESY
jgi:Transposase IS4